MINANPVNRNRRSVAAFLVLVVLAAGLATATATPAGASANLAAVQHNEWHTEVDDPTLHPSPLSGGNWRFGRSTDDGNGPAIYFGHRSNYTYLDRNFNPANHWAEWDMGHHHGTQEIQLFIPKYQANARVQYRILVGSRTIRTPVIRQIEILNGWHSIRTVDANGSRIRIQAHWEDSSQDPQARTWLLGIDTARMRCVSNCTSRPAVPSAMVYSSGRKWNAVAGATSYDVQFWPDPTEEIHSYGCCGEDFDFLPSDRRYRVRAINSAGAGNWSDWVELVSASTVPAVPSGLRFSSGRVMWGSVSGATSYDVRVCTNDGCVTHREIDCCEWRFGDGPFNSIRVRAVNSAGDSDWSTRVDGPLEEAPPSPPRSLQLRVVDESDGSRTAVATWSPPSDDGGSAITNYVVTISRPGGEFGPWSPDSRSFRFRRVLSNTTYTFEVRAENAAGVSPTASRSITIPPPEGKAPSPPRSLQLRVVDESDGSRTAVATWSPPSDDGGSAITNYVVTISRPGGEFGPWSPDSRSFRFRRVLSNTTYTFEVRAQNAVGISPTTSRSITTPPPGGEAPSQPRSLQLRVVDESDGSRTVVATWSPPSDDGGSAITYYRVTISRPGRAWTFSRSPNDRTLRFRRVLTNTTYTVVVRAENAAGTGAATSRSITTPSRDRQADGCPTRNKYTVARDGLWPSPHRITSQQQFETIDDTTVRANTKGGIVTSGNINLTQSGCSWIAFDAEVVGEALISENALVAGEARVYGQAEVYGDAKVYGQAEVYGDAKVYGQAEVYGDAKVHGSAHVKGTAWIFGNVEIESGVYDGKQEFEREMRILYIEIAKDWISRVADCTTSAAWNSQTYGWERLVQEFIYSMGGISPAFDNLDCDQLKLLRTIVLTWGPADIALSYGLTILSAAKLPLFLNFILETYGTTSSAESLYELACSSGRNCTDEERMLVAATKAIGGNIQSDSFDDISISSQEIRDGLKNALCANSIDWNYDEGFHTILQRAYGADGWKDLKDDRCG